MFGPTERHESIELMQICGIKIVLKGRYSFVSIQRNYKCKLGPGRSPGISKNQRTVDNYEKSKEYQALQHRNRAKPMPPEISCHITLQLNRRQCHTHFKKNSEEELLDGYEVGQCRAEEWLHVFNSACILYFDRNANSRTWLLAGMVTAAF
ncbi:hypothetical protein CPB84DRAFT_308705 [Gymnopilus junonius]|uniref:Uncharacterized protein n=1 Tax=Gymnopilus junonius TaxID=109634 RepID=A0A9P5NV42_GYMJU|nr:hypothetical protein CPB84DRAFT_308705 [Gymnopilus junonius]